MAFCKKVVMETYKNISGVPDFQATEYAGKQKKYCLLIPIINEGDRIKKELFRAKRFGVSEKVDIIICDGGSTDGCTDENVLKKLNVNTLLVKLGEGKQGATAETEGASGNPANIASSVLNNAIGLLLLI